MFHGSLVALVTPMQANGAIDYAALDRLVAWHLEQGTDGLVILGTTGEAPTVLANERKQMINHVIAQVNDRCPVIVGTSSNDTNTAIALTRQAMELGADAVLVATPYYNKPTQEGLYRHYSAIAKAVPIPLILYNVPSRTACDMLPETAVRLSTQGNIVGLKEAAGKIERVQEILTAAKGGLDLFSGDDNTAAEFMLAGGRGVITVAGNVVPKLMHKLCRAAIAAVDREQASRLDQSLKPLFKALGVETNPIPVKFALHEMGMIEQGIRLPLTWLNELYHQQVRSELKTLGLLNADVIQVNN